MNPKEFFIPSPVDKTKKSRVFDWNYAAELIRESGGDSVAEAGLSEDWGFTGGIIFENGNSTSDHYTYLGSTWATPVLRIGDMEVDCWKFQDETDGWTCDTKWPQSALDILNAPKAV